MKTITTSASCRVDLAGGTLDIWPLYLFHPGAMTVHFACGILTHCRITIHTNRTVNLVSRDTGKRDRFSSLDDLLSAKHFHHPLAGELVKHFAENDGFPRHGFTLETDSESPAGAGISGSSALMIATTAALAKFTGRNMSKEQMRVVSQNVEARLIRVPTGCQDYYPALFGGVGAVHLEASGIRREGLKVNARELEKRCLLVYTGAPRQSGINNWEVFQAHINGNKYVHANFEEIASIARSMRSALLKSQWDEVARLLRAEWTLRRTNAPGITTKKIENIVEAALSSGAHAAKVCGAGGGGCIILLINPDMRQHVTESVVRCGGKILPARVYTHGVTVNSN